MSGKKSAAVLFTAISKKLSGLSSKERQMHIGLIEGALIDLGVLTREEINTEADSFSQFVDDIEHYMEDQQMNRETALTLALKRYPQFSNTHKLLN